MGRKVIVLMIGGIILLSACAGQDKQSSTDSNAISFTFLEQQSMDLTKLSDFYSFLPDYDAANFAMWGIQMTPFTDSPNALFDIDESNLQDVDFTETYLLLSFNRKVKELFLVDTAPLSPPGVSPSDGPHGSAVLGAEYYPDTVFIYKFDRIEIKNILPSAVYDSYTRVAE